MAHVGALIKGKGLEVHDGIYLERRDVRELDAEMFLRDVWARRPKPRLGDMGWQRVVDQALSLEPGHKGMSDAELKAAFWRCGAQMQSHGFGPEWVAASFAAVREACRRTLAMRHHDVQLAGAWALLHGKIAEMATGEGKTLVAALAACVGASTGAAVHVVTVNDYLSKRDAQENTPLFEFLGLRVGSIEQGMEPAVRQRQYACDIAYASNKELVFDYLKDQLAIGHLLHSHVRLRRLYASERPPSPLLRGLHMAIVDEADSVLIDEARTPLILSESLPDEMGPALYRQALAYSRQLEPGRHYQVANDRQVWLHPEGERLLQQLARGESGVWRSPIWRHELAQKALSALHVFRRDEHYIVAFDEESGTDKVRIVDEYTGRVMPDRSWERGLHQMIEAKEGVEITGQRKTLAQLTYQRFFKRYLLLAGMTGTAQETAPELKRVYDLDVLAIPTHKSSQRRYWPPRCWRTEQEKWTTVASQAAAVAAQGRAVLVGTRSVQASEALSRHLQAQGIAHTVLNARQDADEAESIKHAGEAGRITVATNMAGRGTDIKPPLEVKDKGGLHVILTEYHESARIDRQLFGRGARQGDPGSVQAMVCLEDDTFVRYAPVLSRWLAKATAQGDEVPAGGLRWLVGLAQSVAERQNRRIRLEQLKHDRQRRDQMGFAGRL